MTTTFQTEAGRLAVLLDATLAGHDDPYLTCNAAKCHLQQAAAELRRLDAEVMQLKSMLGRAFELATKDAAERDQLRAQVEQLKDRLFSALEADETLSKAREKVDGVDRISPMDMSNLLDVASANHAEAKAMRAQVERLQGGEPVGFIASPLAWSRFQSETVIKVTRQSQPEYGFTHPLYTAQPAAPALVPLSIERIAELWEAHIAPAFGLQGVSPVVFARSVELAHGIGQPVGGEK